MKTAALKRYVDPQRPITYGIVQAGPDFPGGVPYIRPVDMVGHSGVPDPKMLRTTSPEIAATYSRSSVTEGDVIVSIGPSFGKTMVVPPELRGANLTQGTARVAPSPLIDRRFLVWALQSTVASSHWEAAVGGATFRALNLEPLAQTPIPEWAADRQVAIADHLDAVTSQIDGLIAKKRAMLDLAEERWRAQVRWLVHQSDWPWVPLRRLWTVTDCKHVTPSYTDLGVPVVSPGDVTPGRLDLQRCHRFVDELAFADLTSGGRRPVRGDVVYSRNASIGVASYVDTDERFTMGQDVCLVRSSTQNQLWLSYMLNSVGVDQLQEMKIGSTFDRVNIAQLMDVRIPAPDSAAQAAEAARLDAERTRADLLQRRLTAQVQLLEEHRQALITAAVTGALAIPGVAK